MARPKKKIKKSSKKLGKKLGKKMKAKKPKKVRDTGGFPDMVALTAHGKHDQRVFSIHDMDFANINKNTIIGIYKFRRVAHVAVTRKLKRNPTE